MVKEVRRLLSELLSLERLLADLLSGIPRPAIQELRRVGALRHLPAPPGYRPGEPREGPTEVRGLPIRVYKGGKKAAPLAGVARGSRRLNPVEQRVAVTVESYFDDCLGVAARLSLA